MPDENMRHVHTSTIANLVSATQKSHPNQKIIVGGVEGHVMQREESQEEEKEHRKR